MLLEMPEYYMSLNPSFLTFCGVAPPKETDNAPPPRYKLLVLPLLGIMRRDLVTRARSPWLPRDSQGKPIKHFAD